MGKKVGRVKGSGLTIDFLSGGSELNQMIFKHSSAVKTLKGFK